MADPLTEPCDLSPSGNRSRRRKGWERVYGPIPDGHELHHICGNPACRTLSHLTPVTRGEHMRLGPQATTTKARHAAVTHCPHGHEYTPENTGVQTRQGYPNRYCRTCRRERDRRRREVMPR